MLPDNQISSNTVPSPLVAPDNINRVNRKIDYELGPIALLDTTKGLMHQNWKAWVEDNNTKIYCAPENDLQNKILLLTDVDITEISFTFDQLARVQVAYSTKTTSKLWWYDASVANQVTTEYPGIVSPMLAMDDKRATASGKNDIIFAYIRNAKLYYRQQRDRYLIERDLGDVPMGVNRISTMGMASNYRFVFAFSKRT